MPNPNCPVCKGTNLSALRKMALLKAAERQEVIQKIAQCEQTIAMAKAHLEKLNKEIYFAAGMYYAATGEDII